MVCDGVIAPGYAPGTVDVLSRKKSGRFLIMEADPAFTPPPRESREVFGVRLTQDRDQAPLSAELLQVVTGPPLTEAAVSDLLLALVVLRHTQSNSVCYVRDNVDHASRHGVTGIAEPGGSVRGDQVAAACQEYGITLARTGLRLFHH